VVDSLNDIANQHPGPPVAVPEAAPTKTKRRRRGATGGGSDDSVSFVTSSTLAPPPPAGRGEEPDGSWQGRRGGPAHAAPRPRGRTRGIFGRRRIIAAILVVVAGVLIWLGISLGGALTNPALGSSLSARFAEWAREHGAGAIVNWVENEWYSHHPPPKGGKPPASAFHHPVASTTVPQPSAPAHLTPPAPIIPAASPVLPGEGQWVPAGRTVGGLPAVYETTLRPDAVHTSYVVGVAWMDTKLLEPTLYSGSQIPGGGPYTHTAPIQPAAATSLVAAFNAGFLMSQSNGGYFTDGRAVVPLRNGAASFVIYRDGTCALGAWGRDVTMTPDVVAVRQNLDLLVDNGAPAAGLNAADTTQWGFTLGNNVYVWRSGLGITATGALVYVGGPGLNITDLADLLVRAGAVRAMELDINTDWVNLATYKPATPDGAATPANGTNLLSGVGGTSNMVGQPDRYFQSYWARDFITMSAVPTPPPGVASPASGTSGSAGRTSNARSGTTSTTG
jgi:hypothetical protein